MSDYLFEDARRENMWLRMLLMGPTGAGKTRGALEVATSLYGGELQTVGIDSEHGRMKLEASRYAFKHFELVDDFSPEAYTRAMKAAERQFPGGVLVVDSISHEWMGKNGILQTVDRFGDWKDARPRHRAWLEEMLGLQMHLIVCVRAKMSYKVSEVEEGNRTRQVIEKLGIGPVQDDAIIYEFDVVGTVDAATHETTFTNRCDELVDKTFSLVPGGPVAEVLTKWLSEGDPPAAVAEADEEQVAALLASLREEGHSGDLIEQRFQVARGQNRGKLHPDYVVEQLAKSKERLVKRKPAAEPKEAVAS